MSKVAIKGNASGTATYTLEAPAGSTDRTLVLPDEAGTVLTSGGDHLVVDQYYMTSTTSGTQEPITNWARTTNNFSPIGGGVSHNSGIFSFPKTGMYKAYIHVTFDENGSGADNSISAQIFGTSDNFSTTNLLATQSTNLLSGNQRACVTVMCFFNCTDITNEKIRFDIVSQNASNQQFGTLTNYTMCSFERIGDAA